ncbi:hypothetical protein MOF8_04305 [Methylobacterium oryzae]|uniref:phosphoribosyltransferase-like protein n=1 Tax=Methylobacterium oryzae TaxID=334852 RepID=UPI002F312553
MAKRPINLTVQDIEEFAERFASEHLDPYADELVGSNRKFRRKEVNDALWGTISLSPLEVALLDSPLIQRLRAIRQLGVVHWVYPGAVHTRFEHTIGVLHQVQNLSSSINGLAAQRDRDGPIRPWHLRLLRLSALLHDVGHAAFSHVSEKAIQSLPAISTISAEFSKIHRQPNEKIETKQLSEIFAYFIIKSKPMIRLLEILQGRVGETNPFAGSPVDTSEKLVNHISRAIIGVKIDDRLPLLHQLISGPFDADKLDYFARDARQAGTPSVLDISRLVQKISYKELDAADLPDDIAGNVSPIDDKHCLFGLRWSGVAVLDELHLARILLYAKIYRHTKVIAIEQMLKSALFCLADVLPPLKLVEFVYHFDDDALLSLDEEKLIDAVGLDGSALDVDQKERIKQAVLIFQNVRMRRLAVKAFQLQLRYPADPRQRVEEQKFGLAEFMEDIEHPQNGLIFRKHFLDEVETIQDLLKKTPKWTRVALEASIMIHTQQQTPGGLQIQRAFLLPTDGPPMSFREYTVNRQAWAASYASDQPAGFIFSNAAMADVAYVAVEKLLRERYKVRLPPSALELSKREGSDILTMKRELFSKGYYDKSPYDIRPIPERIGRVDINNAINRIAEKLAVYQEPQNPDQDGDQINTPPRERIISWLRQFEQDSHIEMAVRLLDRFRFLTRADAVAALKKFIDTNPEYRGAWVVPFGDVRDSGAIQTYYSADLQPTYISGCKSMDDIYKGGDSTPIVIVDDFIGSGGQATDILAAGFGMPGLRRDLGEARDLFDEKVQDHLKNVKTAFVFTAAWDEGIRAIHEITAKIGLNSRTFYQISEDQIPFAFENSLDDFDDDDVETFRERCLDIGKSLIDWRIRDAEQGRPVKTKAAERRKKAASRALGYGNRAMLLGTPYNVPTQSLTCLWQHGDVLGVEWTPLMARRTKK